MTRLAIIATALAVVPGVARAQLLEAPRPRQGYYVGVGLLTGASRNWEEGESLGTWPGSTFTLRFGQLLTPRLGLGLQIAAGNSQKDRQTATTFGLTLESHVEIIPNLAAHVGAGLGILSLHDSRVANEELRGSVGAEYLLGVSYAFYPFHSGRSGGLALTPVLEARLLPDDSATGLTVLLGLEIAWWTGLPRNQLLLPEADAYRKAN